MDFPAFDDACGSRSPPQTIDLDGNDTLCLDGEVSEYGNSEDSRQFTVSNNVRTATYLWSVKQQTAAFGKSIKYVYHNDVMAGVCHPIYH